VPTVCLAELELFGSPPTNHPVNPNNITQPNPTPTPTDTDTIEGSPNRVLSDAFRRSVNESFSHTQQHSFPTNTAPATSGVRAQEYAVLPEASSSVPSPRASNSFRCSICGYVSTRRPDLKRHVETHYPPKERFACPHCEKDYTRKWKCTDHIKDKHDWLVGKVEPLRINI